MAQPDLLVEAQGGTARLVARFEEECYYAEFDDAPLVSDISEIEKIATDNGLELMTEDECPSQTAEDGTVTIWCALVDGGL